MDLGQEVNLFIIIVVAGINCVTALIASRTRKDMKQLEKNTNSKMDTLLDTTQKLAMAQGEAKGLKQGRQERKDDKLT